MQRYRLIREYSCRPMIPQPLCAIRYPVRILENFIKIYKHCMGSDEDDDGLKSRNNKSSDTASGTHFKKRLNLRRKPPKAFGEKC